MARFLVTFHTIGKSAENYFDLLKFDIKIRLKIRRNQKREKRTVYSVIFFLQTIKSSASVSSGSWSAGHATTLPRQRDHILGPTKYISYCIMAIFGVAVCVDTETFTFFEIVFVTEALTLFCIARAQICAAVYTYLFTIAQLTVPKAFPSTESTGQKAISEFLSTTNNTCSSLFRNILIIRTITRTLL